jgi:hypothetical protein
MFQKTRSIVLAFAFVGVGVVAGSGTALAVAQAHMAAASGDLQSAAKELGAAKSDKKGHRVKALALVNQAMTEVKAGIAAGAK